MGPDPQQIERQQIDRQQPDDQQPGGQQTSVPAPVGTEDIQIRARLLRYRLLVELTALLARSNCLSEVLDSMHARLRELFAAPVTVLARLRPDGHWDCLTRESDELHHKQLLFQPDGLLERALRGTLTYSNDLAAYAEREGLTLRRLDSAEALPPTVSWMGVPLPGSRGPQGVVSIQSYVPDAFSDEDLEFLTAFAAHLGTVLENAVLRERLEREARTDELTGLGNRRSFGYAGTRLLEQGAPFVLVVLDLQGFKRINDEYGHAGGDRVLRQVAGLLRDCAGPGGRAFRLGGDEFVLLLPGDEAASTAQLEQLRASMKAAPWATPVLLNLGLASVQDLGPDVIGREVDRGEGRDLPPGGERPDQRPDGQVIDGQATDRQHPDSQAAGSQAAGGDSDSARLDALVRRADERMYEAKARGLFIGGGLVSGALDP